MLLALPIAVVVFVRFFRRLSLTTAYEYLERRFDLKVRLLASFLFLLLRSLYVGVVLFATAVALRPTTGWEVWQSIVLVGVVSTAYTTMGGMRSVIWTDVIQFIVLLGGVLLVLGMLIADHPEGAAGVWNYAKEQGHTFNRLGDPSFYKFDPYSRLSLWALIAFAIFSKLGYTGADQISIQRYLSTRNEKDASRSLIWGAFFGIPVVFLLSFVGLGLLYYYDFHPEKALPEMTGDDALAHFISSELPGGVGGIIMAAILAAVMSTVDSTLNSLSTCTVTDFYARLIRPSASETEKVRVAQGLTVVWGALCIGGAMLIVALFGAETRENSLVVVSNVTIGLFLGILLGVFLLGILTRRANANGVLCGAAAGLAAALAVTTFYYFTARPPGSPRPSFLWISMIGCATTTIVGYAVSLLFRPPGSEQLQDLTYWDSHAN
jgi:SSS family transporter